MASTLVTDFVVTYEKIWDDAGSGAVPVEVSIFRPVPPEGFFILGDYAQRGHIPSPTLHRVICVREEPPKRKAPEGPPLLMPPVDYVKVWEDIGSKPKYGPCSIWRAVPPEDYVSVGDIAHPGYDKPLVTTHRCIHKSIAVAARPMYEPDGLFIWCDRDSRAKFGDVSLWSVSPVDIRGISVHSFVASRTYLKPSEPIYCLKRVDMDLEALDGGASEFGGITALENESYEPVSVPSTPMEGPPPYATVEYVPFSIVKEDALRRTTEWAQSLWFAPSQFASSPVDLQESFVPFYVFATSTSTRYFGQVAVHFPMRVPSHQWLTVTGQYNNFIPVQSVPATHDRAVAEGLRKIGPWTPEGTLVGDANIHGREQPTDWRAAWAVASNEIVASERAQCVQRVEAEYHAERVDICSETYFSATTFRVVYMPVWLGHVRHAGTEYPIAVNGVTGQVFGNRPYGPGALGRGLEAIGEVIAEGVKGLSLTRAKKDDPFNGADPSAFGIVTGEELIKADGAKPGFTASRLYLVFPPSSGVITSNTGYVVIENASVVETIELAGFQRRGDGTRRGFPFEIKPGQRRVVTFRGAWCLEIISGNANIIKVEGWGPSCNEDYHTFNMYG